VPVTVNVAAVADEAANRARLATAAARPPSRRIAENPALHVAHVKTSAAAEL
jgi:hypothetical protein